MPDSIDAIFARIADGTYSANDVENLRSMLLVAGEKNLVQVGKYNIRIEQGQSIQIGDVTYQGTDAEAIRRVLQQELEQRSFSRYFSRRKVLLALVALAAVGGSGVIFIRSHTPILPGTTIYTYRGHKSAVTSVAWSANALRIATASADHTAQAWDAITGDHVVIYPSHRTYVWSVSWAPDSKKIASGGREGYVHIWDATDISNTTYNQKVIICEGHTDSVGSVSWAFDGQYVVSGSDDTTVRFWNPVTGNILHICRGHSRASVK